MQMSKIVFTGGGTLGHVMPNLYLIDEDNLEWLKSTGKGYQPRLNNVIRWAKLNNCPIEKM